MSLTEFHCEAFEVEAHFGLEDFDKEAFLLDVDAGEDHDPAFRWSFGSTEKRGVEHAHLFLTIPTTTEEGKENKGRMILSYHSSDADIDDVRPPYMEDVGDWLGRFLNVEEMGAYFNAFFRFGEEYESTLSLPFPLVTENKALSGSTVSGVTVEPPAQSPLRRVMIQRSGTDTIVYASGKTRINLKTFDISKEVETVSTQVRGLVREKKE